MDYFGKESWLALMQKALQVLHGKISWYMNSQKQQQQPFSWSIVVFYDLLKKA